MGHKLVCIECKKSFNQGINFKEKKAICPNCGKQMILLSHRFRPPKKTENKKWETIRFLIKNGFYYQHIYKKVETKNGITSYQNYVEYPDNIQDAKEFVEKYKDQNNLDWKDF